MTEPAPPETLSDLQVVGRLWRTYLARRKAPFALSILGAAMVAGLYVAVLGLLKRTMEAMQSHEGRLVSYLALGLVGVAILRAVVQIGQGMLVNRVGNGVVGDVQKDLFSRLVRADLARLRATHSGGFISSVLYDAGLIREAATNGVVNYTQQVLTVVGMIIYLFVLDPWLTLGLMVVAPPVVLMLRQFNRRTSKAARGTMAETSALSAALMEGLDGVRVVKIENREAYEEARVAGVVDRRQAHLIKGSDAKAQLAPATDMVGIVLVAAALAYAGLRGLNAVDFTVFVGALTAAGNSLRQVANVQGSMAEGVTAARRLLEALDVEPEIRERAGAQPLVAAPRRLEFDKVSFAYGDGAPVLSEVSLHVVRGETIALVGPSGGGKSTTLNLIPRFYDVTAGSITLDGRDLRDLDLPSLRSHIGLVTQEPFLFDDTISANIAYARPGASEDEIAAAAQAAAAHDFITDLPDGYRTRVGEAGMRLSGGQRQRIAIARAFLKDAPILLLDEATSALDAESEAQVQVALERLMQGRATIVIAHRLSTVRHANRIYVLEAGRVVEQGDHETLVAQGGLYARLAKGQDLTTLAP
ncbi:MAG: transporter related [Caulobacteraceae bacterium]|nr:transporter related [Caulobacteraceae bacterium]